MREISLELPDNFRVRDLKSMLADLYPAAAATLGVTLVSINRVYAEDEDPIPAGAEVAMFPHVSGG